MQLDLACVNAREEVLAQTRPEAASGNHEQGDGHHREQEAPDESQAGLQRRLQQSAIGGARALEPVFEPREQRIISPACSSM